LCKRYLDAGARGILAPLVRTKEEAAMIVDAVKYPPMGNRGVGFCRANQYGLNLQAEFERANEANLVAVQIEHIDAVRNIDEILSVKGVDAAFIGPYDLTASMGITAQFEHPDYLAAKSAILAACVRNNTIPGIHVVDPDAAQVKLRVEEGYRLIAYSLDITFLTCACKEGLRAIFRDLGR
jgi:2-dehydro-3-deoxyglucarate aldolase